MSNQNSDVVNKLFGKKLTETGDTLWTKAFPHSDAIQAYSAVETSGGDVVVCGVREAVLTNKDGFIQMFTHSIRTGEVLSLGGKANMQLMDPEECHEIN